MIVYSRADEMQRVSDALRREGKRIAVVPTMGSLHDGHSSLIRLALEHADTVITTLFVNPKQFGPQEDFTRYPRDLERDTSLAESAGSTILFSPATEELYPDGYRTYVGVEGITNVLEGKYRPTHFRGVTTIVAKLFNITKPHVAVFGQKDAQQAVVVKRMTRDLNFDIAIVVAPIVREPDGLAMSSRNVYLSPKERMESAVLSRSLQTADEMIRAGERNSHRVIDTIRALITSGSCAELDYISVADAVTLEERDRLNPGDDILISLAARFGTTRLIDNTLIHIGSGQHG